MKINEKVLDQLLAECENPEQIVGENGLLKQLTKAVLERALEAEMSHHLGYESTPRPAATAAILATALRRKSCKATSAPSRSTGRATVTPSLSRASSAKAGGGWAASTRRSSRCTRAA